MVTVVLEPDLDSLLRQTAADLEMSPEDVGKTLLESALLLSLTR